MTAASRSGFKHFFTQVAGVKHENADGSSRQDIIALLNVFDVLKLEAEPDNEHDPNAVMVLTEDREQIGYLPREYAFHAARELAEGWAVNAFVVALLEDEEDDGVRWVHIVLVVSPPEATDEDAQAYLDRITPQIQARAHEMANLDPGEDADDDDDEP
jgi:hypothetical protein